MKILSYLYDFVKPFDFVSFKVKSVFISASIFTLISAFFEEYFGISGFFAFVLFITLVANHITGVGKAIKQGRKVRTSKALKTVWKMAGYLFFILVAYNLQKEVAGAFVFDEVIKYMHVYVIVHVCIWELYSVDENLKALGINLGITYILDLIKDKLKK